jgi:hypothetical protein
MTFHSQFGLGNPPLHPAFVNLGSDYDFITPMKANTNPTHGANTHVQHMQHQQLLESRGKDHQCSYLLLKPMIKTTR